MSGVKAIRGALSVRSGVKAASGRAMCREGSEGF